MMHVFHRAQVDRLFDGRLGPAATAALLRRLWRCADCRARYERHLLFERVLPGGADRRDDRLWQTIARSADRDPRSRSSERPVEIAIEIASAPPGRRWWMPLVATGALALIIIIASRPAGTPGPSLPVSRGAVEETGAAPALHLYRTIGEHETAPIERSMRANDGILIAYSNPGPDLKYLMVFAVDTSGNIHWYYPAYERAGEDPPAALIRTGAVGVELGEEIRHPLAPGALRVFGLFLPRPWHVEQIERLVAEAWGMQGRSLTQLTALPVAEGKQVSHLLEVTP